MSAAPHGQAVECHCQQATCHSAGLTATPHCGLFAHPPLPETPQSKRQLWPAPTPRPLCSACTSLNAAPGVLTGCTCCALHRRDTATWTGKSQRPRTSNPRAHRGNAERTLSQPARPPRCPPAAGSRPPRGVVLVAACVWAPCRTRRIGSRGGGRCGRPRTASGCWPGPVSVWNVVEEMRVRPCVGHVCGRLMPGAQASRSRAFMGALRSAQATSRSTAQTLRETHLRETQTQRDLQGETQASSAAGQEAC